MIDTNPHRAAGAPMVGRPARRRSGPSRPARPPEPGAAGPAWRVLAEQAAAARLGWWSTQAGNVAEAHAFAGWASVEDAATFAALAAGASAFDVEAIVYAGDGAAAYRRADAARDRAGVERDELRRHARLAAYARGAYLEATRRRP